MIIYRCKVDSPHFFFEAFGATPDEALAAFAKGLAVHAQQTGADPAWVAESIKEAAPAEPISLGACYRDGEPVYSPARSQQADMVDQIMRTPAFGPKRR